MALAGEGYSPTQLLEAFNAGADDCLVVPFSLAEMLARVNALLRRTIPSQASVVLSSADVELDRAERRVRCDKKPVHLTARQFALLEFLLERPGHVLSRAQLQKAWTYQQSARRDQESSSDTQPASPRGACYFDQAPKVSHRFRLLRIHRGGRGTVYKQRHSCQRQVGLNTRTRRAQRNSHTFRAACCSSLQSLTQGSKRPMTWSLPTNDAV
jgi:hypothetical protein